MNQWLQDNFFFLFVCLLYDQSPFDLIHEVGTILCDLGQGCGGINQNFDHGGGGIGFKWTAHI